MTKQMTPREARIEAIIRLRDEGQISDAEAQERIVLADEESR